MDFDQHFLAAMRVDTNTVAPAQLLDVCGVTVVVVIVPTWRVARNVSLRTALGWYQTRSKVAEESFASTQ